MRNKQIITEQREEFTNPLPQKVEYDLEEHFIYGKQKGWKKVFEWIITILAWTLLLSYVLYLIYGSFAIKYNWYLPEFIIYTREMVLEIQHYFYILYIAMLIFIILFIFWKNYNKQKYGKLHRRQFRPAVTNKELAEIFETDEEFVKEMQTKRHIVLETNIVPKDLGIGYKDKK